MIWFSLLLIKTFISLFPATNGKCLDSVKLKTIPSNHLIWKLDGSNKHGLVIGHMGNTKDFQENTLEGMKSLITIKADGMHMNVQLTKDDQLILFRDDNALRLAGENYDIARLPYSEIAKMRLRQRILYGKEQGLAKEIEKVYSSSDRGIPLLRDVLNNVKSSGLLIYIEMMPGNVPPTDPADRHRADVTAKKLAELLTELNMRNEVVVVSRDAFKLKALSTYDPNIVTAWWFDESYYDVKIADKIKYEYADMPEIYKDKCFDNANTGFSFTKYLFTSGIISKTVNASLVDVSYIVFDDSKYFGSQGNSINTVVKTSYGQDVSLGTFKIFSLGSQKQSKNDDIKFADSAFSRGVKRYITDDVNRMKLALQETVINYSQGNSLRSGFTALILIVLFTKLFLALIYV